jgi:hypothetical protein
MEKKENIRRLVDALRSDRFKQGIGRLHKQYRELNKPLREEHCCLGVGCVIAKEAGVEIETTRCLMYGDDSAAYAVVYGEDELYLPEDVRTFFGFDTGNPVLIEIGGVQYSASNLNDEGLTFDQIADIMEWRYLS